VAYFHPFLPAPQPPLRIAEIMAATAVADAVTLVQLKTARMRPSAFAHDIKRRSTGARITKSRE
jgi:hypothetical protein